MRAVRVFRSAVFGVLGTALFCAQALAQSPGVRTGAPPTPPRSIFIDGDSTGQEWAGVRPLAFKLDEVCGEPFSTVAEDTAADVLVYMTPNAGTAFPNGYLNLLFDLPVLTDATLPPAGEALLGVDVPLSNGVITTITRVKFVANASCGQFYSCLLPPVAGLTGRGSRTVQGGVARFRFELQVPLGVLQFNGNGALLRAFGPDQREIGSFQTSFDVDPFQVTTVSAFAQVPLAANSVTQYVRDTLSGLRGRLTNMEHAGKLNEAIAKVGKALGPALYVDQGHLVPNHGEKVFRYDREAVAALFQLLRKLNIPASVYPDDELFCLPNDPTADIGAPINGCAAMLFGITRDVAETAVLELESATPGSPAASAARLLLNEGDQADWTVSNVEAIKDYGQAWDLVTR